MSTTTAAKEPARKESAMVEYVPFGATDPIKLSVAMVKSMIAVPTKSKKYPDDNDCIKFIALCQARKLNPFEGDAFLIGYDSSAGPKFNLITSIQAFLKRAEAHPLYNGMKSGIIIERDSKIVEIEGDFYLKHDRVLGGWATVYIRGRDYPITKKIRLERFKKEFGVWLEDAAGMICKCAEADALRTSFPNTLGGLYLPQEMPSDVNAKVTAPVFNAPEPKTPAEPEPVTQAPATKADIMELCKRDGIKEYDLMLFLCSIALCEESATTIDKLPDSSVDEVFNRWDEFVTKMNEEPQ